MDEIHLDLVDAWMYNEYALFQKKSRRVKMEEKVIIQEKGAKNRTKKYILRVLCLID